MSERQYPQFPIPGVGAVVFGTKGVLLVRRVKEPSRGLWSIPGGGVELGETQEESVKREVLEETGVSCSVIEFLSTFDIIHRDTTNAVQYHFLLNHYLARALTEEIRPEFPEAEVCWFSPDYLPLDEMPPAVAELIAKAQARINLL